LSFQQGVVKVTEEARKRARKELVLVLRRVQETAGTLETVMFEVGNIWHAE
jgi:hypothetical protein